MCGYLDGIYRWSSADWSRFPNAVKVGIAISPFTNAGQVLDVETGDATPEQAPGWVQRRRAAGVDPTVYINRANWAATRQAFQRARIAEPHYWLAAYDNVKEIPAGTVAKQYANSTMSGGHYDLSAVADHWPGVDPSNPNATAADEVRVQEEEILTPEEHNALFQLQAALVPTAPKVPSYVTNVLDLLHALAKQVADLQIAVGKSAGAPHAHQINGQTTEPA